MKKKMISVMFAVVTDKMYFAVIFALGLICVSFHAFAEDLTVARGETFNLQAGASYDTVTVSGTLNIPAGLTLTAVTLELGPEEGDTAQVNVFGNDATGLKVETVNVGRNGGVGQIAALPTNTDNDDVVVVDMTTVNILRNAAVSPSGFIDFLKLGSVTADFRSMFNESDSRARILVKDSCLGYSQYWGYTMFASGAFRIESFEGGNVRIGSNWSQRHLNSEFGSLVIDGQGHDVIFCRSANGENQFYALHEGVEWANVRNLYITSKHSVVLPDDNLLPYGPGNGGVVLQEPNPPYVLLRIKDTTQRLNWFSSPFPLDTESLTGTSSSKVIFGEGDQDGHLKGRIAADVGVFKVGTGIFSVTNAAQVGSFTVSNGTVRIAAEFNLDSLLVESGATLIIDGVTVVPSSGLAEVRGSLVLLNGGRLEASRMVENDERIAGFNSAGEWTKNGSGVMIIEDPSVMPSNVIVKAGTLAFSAVGYSCDLFKWNVTDWNNVGYFDRDKGAHDYRFYLGELGFVGPAGNRIGAKEIAAKASGTNPGDLEPGAAAFAAGTIFVGDIAGNGNAGNLFDEDQWPRVAVETPSTTNENGVTLYVRLPSGSGPVSAINFQPGYGGCPRAWTLSASHDGGLTWKLLNEEEFIVGNYSDMKDMTWFGTAESGVPLRFRFYSADLGFAVPGVRNMPDSMRVEVAAGAVLDFTNVTGGQTVDAVTIDAASGGGTIRNARFAESGTVFLTGAPDGTGIDGLAIPILFEDCTSAENLHSWRICVDGVMQIAGRYHMDYRNGRLFILGRGFIITVR
ncbi:MAG: hypothetical protein E7046_03190 [Lentisphaerae bacterium]|nr:hypothetical protein [Lentisphaerota bacterium]